MHAYDIDLVRRSFAKLEPIAPQAAALFYDNLFTADPALRNLLRGDMREQGAKLMQMIGAAVSLLDQPELLSSALRKLGARHAGYGVAEPHYASVGGALLRTLQAGLGESFTVEVRNAWVALYDFVSRSMIDAARAEATSAASALRYV